MFAVITLKSKQRGISLEKFVKKGHDRMTNRVDPDQTASVGTILSIQLHHSTGCNVG